jgi:hypothetical protein
VLLVDRVTDDLHQDRLLPPVGIKLGFDADGYLVVKTGIGYGYVLDLLDVERGIVSGSLGASEGVEDGLRDNHMASTSDSHRRALPQEFSVLARDWFAHLCAVADRPFTPAELAILQASLPSVDTEPPCS